MPTVLLPGLMWLNGARIKDRNDGMRGIVCVRVLSRGMGWAVARLFLALEIYWSTRILFYLWLCGVYVILGMTSLLTRGFRDRVSFIPIILKHILRFTWWTEIQVIHFNIISHSLHSIIRVYYRNKYVYTARAFVCYFCMQQSVH